MNTEKPIVAVLMGSTSDWNIMRHCVDILEDFSVPFMKKVVSAHRTPDLLSKFAKDCDENGIKIIIAGAGGAAHLPGMLAANTTIPVFGVPVPSKHLKGLDSLYSIVQMPKGIPVPTFAIGEAGAANAALSAVSILSINNNKLKQKLTDYRALQSKNSLNSKLPT
ncbi:MAG: 5-(carboxyamino)imidazole ribonucleotide mutase [Gammaproteobacteria bacterium]|nr:MAG: 5-(carboxyamino)imidazole ribonucleotide mutase [Gammaproteobacteria bacterium]